MPGLSVDLADPLVVVASRRIDAPAHELFEVLRDPARHPELDGSGMLRSTDAAPLQGVGDTFDMRMHNEEFGDYLMRNHVVEYVADRAIAWAPKRIDVEGADWDQRWGWRLDPDGEATTVTAFFDCTHVPDDGRRILREGRRWLPVLEASLERLEAIATR